MAKLSKTEAARLAAFRKQLAEMPVEYLRCHCFGHKTEPMTVNPEGHLFVMGMVCSSCDMEIDRWRDRATGIVTSRYWHPRHDYYFTGTGQLTPVMKLEIEDAWRAEVKLPRRDEQPVLTPEQIAAAEAS